LRINFFEATKQTACIFSKGDKNNPQGLRVHKHIFVGNSRLVTAMTHTDNNGDNAEQREKRYYYHSDHLGSAQFVTDWRGRQYEHIEYTPYGELWIEEVAAGLDKLPFRFTGKEMDEETGLYYYGARYLDPKYSRWLSGDPPLNDYIPKAPIDDEAKKHNEKLPGMGGVFNVVNLHLYHYAGNNPVKYTDPDGKKQNLAQKIFTRTIAFAADKHEMISSFIKEHTSITVQRSANDNGNNGNYYQSKASVKFLGIPLNSVPVQSTADHPKLNNGEKKYEGGTLVAGEYIGTMLNKSGSYNNAISITGNGVSTADAVLFHPDVFTAKGETESYSSQGKPYSLACQITELSNFDETITILNKLGLSGGTPPENNPSQSWCAGDQIKIKINAPMEN